MIAGVAWDIGGAWPSYALWPTRLGVLDDRGCIQQLPQPLVASPVDAAQALSAGSRVFARRGPGYAGAQIGSCL
jgi:hypothetical protein